MIAEVVIESSPRRVPQLRLDSQLLQLVESSFDFAQDGREKRQSTVISFTSYFNSGCRGLYNLSYMIPRKEINKRFH
jgi:hypothetical protein